MRIKSYFAESVHEAMERARQELGAEAVLINSKNTEPELRNLGKYEIVFGISSSAGKPDAAKAAEAAQSASGSEPVLHELADLRKEVETIRWSLARHSKAPGARRFAPELEDLVVRLEGAGLSAAFAEEMVASIESGWGTEPDRFSRQLHEMKRGLSHEWLDRAVLEEIQRRIRVSAELASGCADVQAVMLVGPPGSGKTTTLVKLALQYGLKARVPVDIITTDSFRVGAWEQLSRYATIAGAPFESFQSVTALASSLEQRGNGRLIFIDTPGYSTGDMAEAMEWAQFAAHSSIDVHLVLPATLRTRIATQIAERFKMFGCAKLILTHWDELDSAGSAFELAANVGLPLSFIGHGQQIPEDLRKACANELAHQVMPRRKSAAVSAA